jgi:phage gp36-like protein
MVYCTPTNLAQYLPAQVLALTSGAQQTQACLDASEEADSYFRGRYALPMSAVGSDVVRYTSWIACYLLCQLIGFAPQAGSDKLIVERYYQAVGWPDRAGTGWFPGVQRQAIHPDVTPALDPVNDAIHGLPQVQSQPMRGWQQTRNGKPVV